MTTNDQSAFGFSMRADPDFKSLKEHFGDEALKTDMKHVIAAVKGLTDSDLKEFLNKGKLYSRENGVFHRWNTV